MREPCGGGGHTRVRFEGDARQEEVGWMGNIAYRVALRILEEKEEEQEEEQGRREVEKIPSATTAPRHYQSQNPKSSR